MFCTCSAEVARHWKLPLTAEKYRAIDEQLPGYGIALHKILLLQSKPISFSNFPSVACGWKHTVVCVAHANITYMAMENSCLWCQTVHDTCFASQACVLKQLCCSLNQRPCSCLSILQAMSRPGDMLHSCAPQWQLKHLNRAV
jgi:hypothetical protein